MSLWIFGYGSLIWNPGFDYEEKIQASLTGWERRFWQGSEDHRGIPGAPGRVLTLVPGSFCEGFAFRLDNDRQMRILDMLDVREKGGYDRFTTPLKLSDGRVVDGLTYIASNANPHFLGDAPTREIVEQIAISVGPSGRNSEYLLELAVAFRRYGIVDKHVNELESALLDYQKQSSEPPI